MQEEKNIEENKKEPEPESDSEKLAKCEMEKNEFLEGWKRAKADFLNYKKDEEKRFEEIGKFAHAALVSDIIPVLDSFDLALSVLEKDGKAEKGIYMIRAKLEDVLKKRGLEKIDVIKGSAFDPSVHEGIIEVESDLPPGSVVEVIESGYSLNGRIIRPVRVKVAKQTESDNNINSDS